MLAMPSGPLFQEDLITRYDKTGPRYTSYPPATVFHDGISEIDYRAWARASNEELIPKPLALYFHIPFCSSGCFYCARNRVITRRPGKADAYLDDLRREIEIQASLFDRDREVRQLHWGGGTPGFLSGAQTRLLMDRIRHHFRLADDDVGEFSIELDPRAVEPGGIALLRKAGFNRISIGVQDFDPRVQQAVNRVQSFEQTAAVVDDAREPGFRPINIDLIYGLPHQSRATFATTLDRVISLEVDRIAIYNYAHLPHRFPPQRRIRARDLPPPDEKLGILRQAIDRLGEAGYLYIGMEHFARPDDELSIAQQNGSLHRSFLGYAAHAQSDTIGLGVSAISQVGDNFSQNTTSLDQYQDALAHDRLPVVRGYRCTLDDLLRREIIQQLVCYFGLDFERIERAWNIDFRSHFASELRRLEGMVDDGLLEIEAGGIRVLTPGRLLVRNICMVFDSYQQSDKVTGLFSRSV